MKKWEYSMLSVSVDTNGYWKMRLATKTLTGMEIKKYFDSLGNVGWEMVSVVSTIGDTNPQQVDAGGVGREFANLMAGPGVTTMTQHKTGTTGYVFSFKREISD